MVLQCAVPGCKSRGKGIKFFSVPFTTRHRWEAWLVACPFLQRYLPTQLENVRICILHFESQSMNDKLKLNPNAIPQLNLPTTNDIQMQSKSQLCSELSVNPIQSVKDLEISATCTSPLKSEMSVLEQDVETGYRVVCCTCLSTDRNLISINGLAPVYQVFRLLMYDFAGNRYGDTLSEMEQIICWECLAMMKRFIRFKRQVHSAQEHIRVVAMSGSSDSMDHTYMSRSLSSLRTTTKTEYDSIFFDYTTRDEWPPQSSISTSAHNIKKEQYDVAQVVRDNINLEMDGHLLEVPQIVLENPVSSVMPRIVVGSDDMANIETYTHMKGELSELNISPIEQKPKIKPVIKSQPIKPKKEKIPSQKLGYFTEIMTEEQMLASREEAKEKVHYASSVYKCELCIIGFDTQQQVEDHCISVHLAKPGYAACKVCYVYVQESNLQSHIEQHYTRYICKLCGHTDRLRAAIGAHIAGHVGIHVGDADKRKKNRKKKEPPSKPPKPGDLRKLRSKTTIEGYQCPECDMFFLNSRARKDHVDRVHREGLQCDHCKKRFVNKTSLVKHLRLHEGPLTREECSICHKMVRVIQLKYHILRHQNKSRYECIECNKVFSHLATYQTHLRNSRAHASDQVFKFPCPVCNKGFPTKEAMQDHFNYQHLGKTRHKCPLCEKPIASRANVQKHILRVHGEKKEKKEKPRNHMCQICGRAFTTKQALNRHEVIHSGARPVTCDICQQSFKQKSSFYTHRKRVHKVPVKKQVEFMDVKIQ